MKNSVLLLACSLVAASTLETRAASYQVVFPPGYTPFCNQLDKAFPATNIVGELFNKAPPDQTRILKWYITSYDVVPNRWDSDTGWDTVDEPLNPGEGAFFFNPFSTPFTNTFTGNPHTPVLPVSLTPGQMYFLSDQTVEVGTYESIVGTSPVEGSTVYIYTNQASLTNFSAWDVRTFQHGAWSPSPPGIPIGMAAFFMINTNLSASVTPPTISGLAILGNNVKFQFNAESNRTYAVEYRTAFGDAGWQILTNIPAQPAATNIQVSDPATGPSRFYRIRTP
jgi:hypothetical protein